MKKESELTMEEVIKIVRGLQHRVGVIEEYLEEWEAAADAEEWEAKQESRDKQ